MVVEIPRWSNAKNEVQKKSIYNPITQQIKKGLPRFAPNIFPYKGYMWNYGAFPQTYEDPSIIDSSTGFKGDGDPVDVLEIGQAIGSVGQIKQVKILGIMGMIDEGETDWKILTIDVNDPISSKLNTITDLDLYMPGFIDATRSWFTDYKVPEGKSQNAWAFDGQAKNHDFAKLIINEAHQSWKNLLAKNTKSRESYFGFPNNLKDIPTNEGIVLESKKKIQNYTQGITAYYNLK
ncbi:hypothetical protein BB561_004546 [Smittium simulii]|uniref:inorganic diphosphatase n=1 Tax=Smittium simulii TaxID=133385 RepID=A0A2T9YFP3_9FUNG|nr:hypothetical protein BB561_004546 [Smittium simulii]